MSKQQNDDLVRKIKSGEAKIERITTGKVRAQGQIDRADQEIAETRVVINGYVGLLEARGLNSEGKPLDGGSPETDEDEDTPEFE